MKHKILLLTILTTGLIFFSCSSNPTITLDPVKDAQTCIKLYEKDFAKGEAYMQEVIMTYYMQGKHSEHDQFSSIVTEKIAIMSLR